ncbi:MAG: NAD-dependent epimerase/dehydratase family protein [Betaproteobacteria bacterium]|nr:NAD-dependent epimerase/dehydratase family protein [Betaproteobacteria bacterium]
MAKLVTGGAGYVGAETVRQLVNRGEEVVAFDIASDTYRIDELGKQVKFVRGDLGNFSEVLNVVKDNKVDAIYHMGSMLSWMAELNPWASFRANVLGTYHVLEACRLFGVPKIMFTSTIGTFGLGMNGVITDDTLQRPTILYGAGKLYGEGLGRWYSDKSGLDFRTVRYAQMIGPNVRTPGHWAPPMIEDAILGKPNVCQYGTPETVGSWIYVIDAAKAAVDILDAPKEKIQTMNYNVTGISSVISAKGAAAILQKKYPGFKVEYKMSTDPRRMPRGTWTAFDDSNARKEWSWSPIYTTPEAIIERFEKDLKEYPKRYGLSQ